MNFSSSSIEFYDNEQITNLCITQYQYDSSSSLIATQTIVCKDINKNSEYIFNWYKVYTLDLIIAIGLIILLVKLRKKYFKF